MITPRQLDPESDDPQVPRAPLPPGPPLLYLVDTRTSAPPAAAPPLLDAIESRRAAALRRPEDRRAYVGAHIALRRVLGAHLERTPAGLEFVRETCPTCGGPHGRPAVAEGGVHFSLSHGGGLALIALAATPVGADVERLPVSEVVTETMGVLHPDETAQLTRLPGAGRPAAFARAWTRKEAYLKGLGTGLSRDPNLDYVGTGPEPAGGLPGWTLHDVAVPAGYAGAVAVAAG
ncbi:4'-phosphopantetheinyl transferase family protein [Streptomyces sp. NPDC050560]|uniref:4'-phosphopantetheinyl transferase family protein n=1 Tax=Streptomyces sp. NPDC050560 TaxID=3365630 RepID=UPI0037A98CE2